MKAAQVHGRLIVVRRFNAQLVPELKIVSMRILLVSALIFVSVMAVAADPQAQDDIVPALRKGGYVLFLND